MAQNNLPFIVVEGDQKNLWSGEATGDWSADVATGQRYASLIVDDMAKNDNPGLLYHVVKAMADRQRFGGIECGFITYLATAALAS